MDQINAFVNNPLVAPLYGLIVVAAVGMLLGMYRSAQQGVFDWKKIPGILDSTILKKVVPLAGLGVASYFVADDAASSALTVAYVTGCAAAYAGEIASLIEKATGGFTATTTDQDKGILSPPFPSTEPTPPVTPAPVTKVRRP